MFKIKSVTWDSKGEFLATCGRDKTIWIWDKDDGFEYSCYSILNGHTQVFRFCCKSHKLLKRMLRK